MSDARNNFGKESVTRKSKKLPVRLDLTALVSISFLLIMFFMLSSYMSRPQAMDLGMPSNNYGCGGYSPEIYCGDTRDITLLLGKNNKIIYYYGLLALPFEGPKKLTYDKNSLRRELINKNKAISKRYDNNPRKGLIVLIKPSKESTYENLIDVLDEMEIVNVKTYAIVDLTPEEKTLLNNL